MMAVIGGGVAGLTAAIRLAGQGKEVHLFEAAPSLGGRTSSFFDRPSGRWCDHGPHLMVGAYRATRRLLRDCGAEDHVAWQPSLELPLWDRLRGAMRLKPAAWLPLPLAMMSNLPRLPGHALTSATSLLRLRRQPPTPSETVAAWCERLRLPAALLRDFMTPLCIGTMNEYPETAPAESFAAVLHEAFSCHDHARLGWFCAPLQEALIEPLARHAASLGVAIHAGHRVRAIERHGRRWCLELSINARKQDGDGRLFDQVILAIPPWVRIRGIPDRDAAHRMITNLHLWYDHPVELPTRQPLIGGIGTLGQWFFDVSRQMNESPDRDSGSWHACIVISADALHPRDEGWQRRAIAELAEITGREQLNRPIRRRVIQEVRATALVRPGLPPSLPESLVDAREAPAPGELPATIEAAVRRGEAAARKCLMSQR